jgi:hypothetical protein
VTPAIRRQAGEFRRWSRHWDHGRERNPAQKGRAEAIRRDEVLAGPWPGINRR